MRQTRIEGNAGCFQADISFCHDRSLVRGGTPAPPYFVLSNAAVISFLNLSLITLLLTFCVAVTRPYLNVSILQVL